MDLKLLQLLQANIESIITALESVLKTIRDLIKLENELSNFQRAMDAQLVNNVCQPPKETNMTNPRRVEIDSLQRMRNVYDANMIDKSRRHQNGLANVSYNNPSTVRPAPYARTVMVIGSQMAWPAAPHQAQYPLYIHSQRAPSETLLLGTLNQPPMLLNGQCYFAPKLMNVNPHLTALSTLAGESAQPKDDQK